MAGRRPKISDIPPLKGSTAVDARVYEDDIQMNVSELRAFVIAGWAVDVAVCSKSYSHLEALNVRQHIPAR